MTGPESHSYSDAELGPEPQSLSSAFSFLPTALHTLDEARNQQVTLMGQFSVSFEIDFLWFDS